MRFFFTFSIVITMFLSCKNKTKKKIDTSQISVHFTVDRFDIDFYTSNVKTLNKVKQKYPVLFPKNTPDSIWIEKINDKEEQELFDETQKEYSDFSKIKKQLNNLFKHIKYYNSNFKVPKVITMITNIDYDNRVIYADSLLLISLDAYLGKEHRFYSDYPQYVKENNHKNHIIVDVANKIINTQIIPAANRSFLEKMIYEGKKRYLLDLYLPVVSDKEKSGYSQKKLNWTQNNEEQIWKYFIENNLLYSTDMDLSKRFLEPAPFSKFYRSQDNLSPGKVGSWIGSQIVHSYMYYNDVSLQQLIEVNAIELFKKSKYKPKKR